MSSPTNAAFFDYFKCPDRVGLFETDGELTSEEGYFRFGGAVCYGRHRAAATGNGEGVPDLFHSTLQKRGRPRLPFDLNEIVRNLRQERYQQHSPHYLERMTAGRIVRDIYYSFRPALPPSVRRHLQRIRLSGWESIPFPEWPVDVTVDRLMQNAMAVLLKQSGAARVPFIWFWPGGARGCAMVTHDVEGAAGREFCGELMDLDDSFGIKSAFQIIPGIRSDRLGDLLETLRARGFEVNLHDLNHDCYLFQNRRLFLERAAEINRYAREFQCGGFRSAAMYREQDWYDAFEFSYDMSVPNVAHLEPQRGGCCTVMPYFVGNVLELPLTTAQDYSLFHILGDYSTALWQRQIALILARNGLITILTHPDYLVDARARAVYVELLEHLQHLRREGEVWFALPGDVDTWWRRRRQMTLAANGDSWRVEGPGSERAVLAYATLEGDRVVYTLDDVAAGVA